VPVAVSTPEEAGLELVAGPVAEVAVPVAGPVSTPEEVASMAELVGEADLVCVGGGE